MFSFINCERFIVNKYPYASKIANYIIRWFLENYKHKSAIQRIILSILTISKTRQKIPSEIEKQFLILHSKILRFSWLATATAPFGVS